MAGLRWRGSTPLMLIAVLAVCLGLQQAPTLSAKDKAKSGTVAAAADDSSTAAAASGDTASSDGGTSNTKPAKKKGKTAPEKKKTAKKKGQQATDDSADSASGMPSGNTTGSSAPTSGSGQSSGPAGRSSTGRANAGTSGKSAPNPGVAGAAAGKPAVAVQAKGGNTAGGQAQQQPAVGQLNANHPLVKKAIDVQNRNTANLMAQKGIVGTATGLDDDDNIVIRVYTTGADSPKIPAQIENVPVLEVLTGPIHPYQVGVGVQPLYQQRIPRPCPIGITAIWDPGILGTVCAAATLGCRLVDSNGNIFGLSNNHVWADENNNPLGTPAVQPSPLDDLCITGETDNIIGTLAAFVPLIFDGSTPNPCDAAVIISNAQLINTSTLKDGYGVPTSTNVKPFLGQLVQKYGRTTGYTRGKVVGINVTATIGYNNGPCLFTDFIDIFPVAPFANFGNPGDSGSLVVDMGRNPLGIVVGGGGGDAFHSPIDVVLTELTKVLIQQGTVPAGTTLQVDSSPPTLIGKEARSTPDSP
jgi:hypothetical protein